MIVLCVLSVVSAQAQYTRAVTGTTDKAWRSTTLQYYTSGDDTATNTDEIRMGIQLPLKYACGINLVITRVSGTIGTSVAYVRASNDGTTWWTLSQGETKAYKDTVSVTNTASATYSFSFSADEINAKFIEVVFSQTGTCVTAPVATLYYRKED